MRQPFALLFALPMIGWGLVPSAAVAQSWETVAPMSTPRTAAAFTVSGGRLYVIGGRDATGQPVASGEVFDPATGTWTPLPPLPEPRSDASAMVANGRIYVLGGTDDFGACDEAFIYDLASGTWSEDDRTLEEDRAGVAAGTVGGQLYALGGANEFNSLWPSAEIRTGADWEIYGPWTLGPARARMGVVSLPDAIVIAGGFSQFGPLTSVERFIPGAASTALPALATARGDLALATDGAALWAVGGRDASDQPSTTVERLALGAGAWTPVTALPAPRAGLAAALLGTDLYVTGGTTSFGTVLASTVRLVNAVTSADEPGVPELTLALAGSNPARGPVAFALSLPSPADVRVAVVDALGREVAVLADGPRGAGRAVLTWDAGRWPPGLYTAVATSGRARVVARVVTVR